MFKDKRVLCIIPARGGSKGIKKKNIYPFLGRPLIYYTINFVRKLDFIDDLVLSTDSNEILEYAQSLGVNSGYIRPIELSGPMTSDKEVIYDVVNNMIHKHGKNYDLILYLQPTSPLRRISVLHDMFTKAIDGDYDSLWTISEIDSKYHPYKQLIINESGYLELFDDNGYNITARQQLGKTYARNGVAYIFKQDFILSKKKLFPTKTGYYVILDKVISIDTVEDLKLVEELYLEGNYE